MINFCDRWGHEQFVYFLRTPSQHEVISPCEAPKSAVSHRLVDGMIGRWVTDNGKMFIGTDTNEMANDGSGAARYPPVTTGKKRLFRDAQAAAPGLATDPARAAARPVPPTSPLSTDGRGSTERCRGATLRHLALAWPQVKEVAPGTQPGEPDCGTGLVVSPWWPPRREPTT